MVVLTRESRKRGSRVLCYGDLLMRNLCVIQRNAKVTHKLNLLFYNGFNVWLTHIAVNASFCNQ